MRQILRSAVNWQRPDKGNVISLSMATRLNERSAVAAAGETLFRATQLLQRSLRRKITFQRLGNPRGCRVDYVYLVAARLTKPPH
jgi:hypothetical protein